MYTKFRNFRDNFVFAKSIKRHLSDAQNSRLRHDLLISVNNRVIMLFREGYFYFHETSHMRNFAKISEFSVFLFSLSLQSYIISFVLICFQFYSH